jgi:hypothetical protein
VGEVFEDSLAKGLPVFWFAQRLQFRLDGSADDGERRGGLEPPLGLDGSGSLEARLTRTFGNPYVVASFEDEFQRIWNQAQ